MALPKRRHSRSRSGKRRANQRVQLAAAASCPRCNQVKEPHRICPNCGTYRGRQVLATEKT